jgi:hypothetical protein
MTDRGNDYIREELRRKVLERDGHRCRYCGTDQEPFHMDHVYPASRGGETSFDNLVTACAWCNLKKHNRVGVWPRPIGFRVRYHVWPIFALAILTLAAMFPGQVAMTMHNVGDLDLKSLWWFIPLFRLTVGLIVFTIVISIGYLWGARHGYKIVEEGTE